uniref:RING-type domain-containing protein n=1 Tax=Salarias fasciatus TaxID=181472 RepID=A0A672HXT2_SALFA
KKKKKDDPLTHELSCPICLQLYSDPVVLPCGHNYCRACICRSTDATAANSNVRPRCPECRREYQGVESLQRNFKLRGIIQSYQAAASQLGRRASDGEPASATGNLQAGQQSRHAHGQHGGTRGQVTICM